MTTHFFPFAPIGEGQEPILGLMGLPSRRYDVSQVSPGFEAAEGHLESCDVLDWEPPLGTGPKPCNCGHDHVRVLARGAFLGEEDVTSSWLHCVGPGKLSAYDAAEAVFTAWKEARVLRVTVRGETALVTRWVMGATSPKD